VPVLTRCANPRNKGRCSMGSVRVVVTELGRQDEERLRIFSPTWSPCLVVHSGMAMSGPVAELRIRLLYVRFFCRLRSAQ
jgi:hypothetical protein